MIQPCLELLGVFLESKQMKTINAIKKLEKSGFQVVQTGNRCTAQGNQHVIGFFNQSGNSTCINVRNQIDRDDSMSDYSAGVFCNNITQAIKLAH